jgi:hypothetical protein
MPTDESAFVTKIREQIELLRGGGYNYDTLHVYVSGIAEPWPFGRDAEFELGDEVLVVRRGPVKKLGNEDVPQYVFPLRQIVATELVVSGG